MHSITVKLVFLVVLGAWLLACLRLYRLYRNAAWLAGSSVASCLFLLGATIAASFFVRGAFFLAPLWLGVSLLLLLHLRAARSAASKERQALATAAPGLNAPVTAYSVQKPGTYI